MQPGFGSVGPPNLDAPVDEEEIRTEPDDPVVIANPPSEPIASIEAVPPAITVVDDLTPKRIITVVADEIKPSEGPLRHSTRWPEFILAAVIALRRRSSHSMKRRTPSQPRRARGASAYLAIG